MIKTIIFDFGDVFLTLDKAATQRYLEHYGIDKLDEDLLEINKQYEQGFTSTKDFIEHYTTRFPRLTKDLFIEAWNSILVEFPAKRLDFIKELKSSGRFQLILLSNTNELHIDWIKANVDTYEEFKSCFDQFYLSHLIHHRKPNRDIFEYVLSKNNLKAEETLFVDDTQEHVETASSMGFNTWHLKAGEEEVTQLFNMKSGLF